jgi:putative MFS transporter
MATAVEQLDSMPISSLHLVAVAACALALGVDVMEIWVGSGLATVFSAAPYHMSAGSLSWIVAAVYIGSVVGAPSLGWLADKIGLRPTLAAAQAWLGLMTFLSAASSNPAWLIGTRLLSGLAIGALPPLIYAYLTGISPAKHRGLLAVGASGFAFLAAPTAIFALRYLTPLHPFGIEGWRWALMIAGCAALLGGTWFVTLPESPRWLAKFQHMDLALTQLQRFKRTRRIWPRLSTQCIQDIPAVRPPPTHATSSPVRFGYTLAICSVIYFLYPCVALGFTLVTGPVLLLRGHNLQSALLYVGLITFGPPISTLLSSVVIDIFPRRSSLALITAWMLISGAVFFTIDSAIPSAVSLISFGMASALYAAVMSLYGAEILPAHRRAAGTSIAWAVNRLASAIVPLTLLPVLRIHGPTIVAVILGAAGVGSILFVLTLGPRGAAGQVVE